jgi:hypothetical protein
MQSYRFDWRPIGVSTCPTTLERVTLSDYLITVRVKPAGGRDYVPQVE